MRSHQSPLHPTPITLSRRGFLKKVFHTIRQASEKDCSSSDMLVMNIDMTTTAMTMTTPTNTTTAITMITCFLGKCAYVLYMSVMAAHRSRLLQPEYVHRPTRVGIQCPRSSRTCRLYEAAVNVVPQGCADDAASLSRDLETQQCTITFICTLG